MTAPPGRALLGRVVRRARDAGGGVIEPMDLGNMRAHGVRAVVATCHGCGHSAELVVDGMAAGVAVPDVGLRLVCAACGGREVDTRPAWHRGATMPWTPFAGPGPLG